MNLYKYLDENIDTNKIKEFEDDVYEIALARYVLIQIAKIFYRNRLFFLDEEQITIRRFIYNEKIDIENIKSYEIVCSSYCKILQDVLKNKFNIETELIEADRDEFKHIVIMLITKKGNRYLIDSLMDLTNMKARMKTHNFGAKEKDKSNPYIRIEIEGLKYIHDDLLRDIDKKIGYLENEKYKDDILLELKGKMKKYKTIGQKIVEILELIKYYKEIENIVDLIIFINSALTIVLTKKEKKKVIINEFFIDRADIKDKDILNSLDNITNRNRGILIECEDEVIAFFIEGMKYFVVSQKRWTELEKNNNIFVKRKTLIKSYKYLYESELETNILDHREFLKIFRKIENEAIKNGDDIKKFINIKDKNHIYINYITTLEFKIENDFLVMINQEKSLKTVIKFGDEGRKVKYYTNKFLND